MRIIDTNIKAAVIDATLELIIESGINELKTAKIAKRAGTSETVIYRHFKNKQDIINQTVSLLLQEQRKKYEAIKNQPLSAIVRLEKLLDVHLNLNEKTKGISRLAFSDQFHLGDVELKQTAKSHLEKYETLLMELFHDGIVERVFRADLDLKMAAQSYIAMIYFIIHKWSFDDFSWSLLNEKEKILQYLLNLWGLRPKSIKL